MIGNDIVDLSAAAQESNWRRKGYLGKIFTLYEQQLIAVSAEPDIVVWTLWAMKEAAYKAHNRETETFEYAPSKIKCLNIQFSNGHITGRVKYNGRGYFAKTFLLGECLHTCVCSLKKDFESIRRLEVRDYPENYLADLKTKGWLGEHEDIKKNNFGVPNLIDNLQGRSYPISISHHGRFLGMVVLDKGLL